MSSSSSSRSSFLLTVPQQRTLRAGLDVLAHMRLRSENGKRIHAQLEDLLSEYQKEIQMNTAKESKAASRRPASGGGRLMSAFQRGRSQTPPSAAAAFTTSMNNNGASSYSSRNNNAAVHGKHKTAGDAYPPFSSANTLPSSSSDNTVPFVPSCTGVLDIVGCNDITDEEWSALLTVLALHPNVASIDVTCCETLNFNKPLQQRFIATIKANKNITEVETDCEVIKKQIEEALANHNNRKKEREARQMERTQWVEESHNEAVLRAERAAEEENEMSVRKLIEHQWLCAVIPPFEAFKVDAIRLAHKINARQRHKVFLQNVEAIVEDACVTLPNKLFSQFLDRITSIGEDLESTLRSEIVNDQNMIRNTIRRKYFKGHERAGNKLISRLRGEHQMRVDLLSECIADKERTIVSHEQSQRDLLFQFWRRYIERCAAFEQNLEVRRNELTLKVQTRLEEFAERQKNKMERAAKESKGKCNVVLMVEGDRISRLEQANRQKLAQDEEKCFAAYYEMLFLCRNIADAKENVEKTKKVVQCVLDNRKRDYNVEAYWSSSCQQRHSSGGSLRSTLSPRGNTSSTPTSARYGGGGGNGGSSGSGLVPASPTAASTIGGLSSTIEAREQEVFEQAQQGWYVNTRLLRLPLALLTNGKDTSQLGKRRRRQKVAAHNTSATSNRSSSIPFSSFPLPQSGPFSLFYPLRPFVPSIDSLVAAAQHHPRNSVGSNGVSPALPPLTLVGVGFGEGAANANNNDSGRVFMSFLPHKGRAGGGSRGGSLSSSHRHVSSSIVAASASASNFPSESGNSVQQHSNKRLSSAASPLGLLGGDQKAGGGECHATVNDNNVIVVGDVSCGGDKDEVDDNDMKKDRLTEALTTEQKDSEEEAAWRRSFTIAVTNHALTILKSNAVITKAAAQLEGLLQKSYDVLCSLQLLHPVSVMMPLPLSRTSIGGRGGGGGGGGGPNDDSGLPRNRSTSLQQHNSSGANATSTSVANGNTGTQQQQLRRQNSSFGANVTSPRGSGEGAGGGGGGPLNTDSGVFTATAATPRNLPPSSRNQQRTFTAPPGGEGTNNSFSVKNQQLRTVPSFNNNGSFAGGGLLRSALPSPPSALALDSFRETLRRKHFVLFQTPVSDTDALDVLATEIISQRRMVTQIVVRIETISPDSDHEHDRSRSKKALDFVKRIRCSYPTSTVRDDESSTASFCRIVTIPVLCKLDEVETLLRNSLFLLSAERSHHNNNDAMCDGDDSSSSFPIMFSVECTMIAMRWHKTGIAYLTTSEDGGDKEDACFKSDSDGAEQIEASLHSAFHPWIGLNGHRNPAPPISSHTFNPHRFRVTKDNVIVSTCQIDISLHNPLFSLHKHLTSCRSRNTAQPSSSAKSIGNQKNVKHDGLNSSSVDNSDDNENDTTHVEKTKIEGRREVDGISSSSGGGASSSDELAGKEGGDLTDRNKADTDQWIDAECHFNGKFAKPFQNIVVNSETVKALMMVKEAAAAEEGESSSSPTQSEDCDTADDKNNQSNSPMKTRTSHPVDAPPSLQQYSVSIALRCHALLQPSHLKSRPEWSGENFSESDDDDDEFLVKDSSDVENDENFITVGNDGENGKRIQFRRSSFGGGDDGNENASGGGKSPSTRSQRTKSPSPPTNQQQQTPSRRASMEKQPHDDNNGGATSTSPSARAKALRRSSNVSAAAASPSKPAARHLQQRRASSANKKDMSNIGDRETISGDKDSDNNALLLLRGTVPTPTSTILVGGLILGDGWRGSLKREGNQFEQQQNNRHNQQHSLQQRNASSVVLATGSSTNRSQREASIISNAQSVTMAASARQQQRMGSIVSSVASGGGGGGANTKSTHSAAVNSSRNHNKNDHANPLQDVEEMAFEVSYAPPLSKIVSLDCNNERNDNALALSDVSIAISCVPPAFPAAFSVLPAMDTIRGGPSQSALTAVPACIVTFRTKAPPPSSPSTSSPSSSSSSVLIPQKRLAVALQQFLRDLHVFVPTSSASPFSSNPSVPVDPFTLASRLPSSTFATSSSATATATATMTAMTTAANNFHNSASLARCGAVGGGGNAKTSSSGAVAGDNAMFATLSNYHFSIGSFGSGIFDFATRTAPQQQQGGANNASSATSDSQQQSQRDNSSSRGRTSSIVMITSAATSSSPTGGGGGSARRRSSSIVVGQQHSSNQDPLAAAAALSSTPPFTAADGDISKKRSKRNKKNENARIAVDFVETPEGIAYVTLNPIIPIRYPSATVDDCPPPPPFIASRVDASGDDKASLILATNEAEEKGTEDVSLPLLMTSAFPGITAALPTADTAANATATVDDQTRGKASAEASGLYRIVVKLINDDIACGRQDPAAAVGNIASAPSACVDHHHPDTRAESHSPSSLSSSPSSRAWCCLDVQLAPETTSAAASSRVLIEKKSSMSLATAVRTVSEQFHQQQLLTAASPSSPAQQKSGSFSNTTDAMNPNGVVASTRGNSISPLSPLRQLLLSAAAASGGGGAAAGGSLSMMGGSSRRRASSVSKAGASMAAAIALLKARQGLISWAKFAGPCTALDVLMKRQASPREQLLAALLARGKSKESKVIAAAGGGQHESPEDHAESIREASQLYLNYIQQLLQRHTRLTCFNIGRNLKFIWRNSRSSEHQKSISGHGDGPASESTCSSSSRRRYIAFSITFEAVSSATDRAFFASSPMVPSSSSTSPSANNTNSIKSSAPSLSVTASNANYSHNSAASNANTPTAAQQHSSMLTALKGDLLAFIPPFQIIRRATAIEVGGNDGGCCDDGNRSNGLSSGFGAGNGSTCHYYTLKDYRNSGKHSAPHPLYADNDDDDAAGGGGVSGANESSTRQNEAAMPLETPLSAQFVSDLDAAKPPAYPSATHESPSHKSKASPLSDEESDAINTSIDLSSTIRTQALKATSAPPPPLPPTQPAAAPLPPPPPSQSLFPAFDFLALQCFTGTNAHDSTLLASTAVNAVDMSGGVGALGTVGLPQTEVIAEMKEEEKDLVDAAEGENSDPVVLRSPPFLVSQRGARRCGSRSTAASNSDDTALLPAPSLPPPTSPPSTVTTRAGRTSSIGAAATLTNNSSSNFFGATASSGAFPSAQQQGLKSSSSGATAAPSTTSSNTAVASTIAVKDMLGAAGNGMSAALTTGFGSAVPRFSRMTFVGVISAAAPRPSTTTTTPSASSSHDEINADAIIQDAIDHQIAPYIVLLSDPAPKDRTVKLIVTTHVVGENHECANGTPSDSFDRLFDDSPCLPWNYDALLKRRVKMEEAAAATAEEAREERQRAFLMQDLTTTTANRRNSATSEDGQKLAQQQADLNQSLAHTASSTSNNNNNASSVDAVNTSTLSNTTDSVATMRRKGSIGARGGSATMVAGAAEGGERKRTSSILTKRSNEQPQQISAAAYRRSSCDAPPLPESPLSSSSSPSLPFMIAAFSPPTVGCGIALCDHLWRYGTIRRLTTQVTVAHSKLWNAVAAASASKTASTGAAATSGAGRGGASAAAAEQASPSTAAPYGEITVRVSSDKSAQLTAIGIDENLFVLPQPPPMFHVPLPLHHRDAANSHALSSSRRKVPLLKMISGAPSSLFGTEQAHYHQHGLGVSSDHNSHDPNTILTIRLDLAHATECVFRFQNVYKSHLPPGLDAAAIAAATATASGQTDNGASGGNGGRSNKREPSISLLLSPGGGGDNSGTKGRGGRNSFRPAAEPSLSSSASLLPQDSLLFIDVENRTVLYTPTNRVVATIHVTGGRSVPRAALEALLTAHKEQCLQSQQSYVDSLVAAGVNVPSNALIATASAPNSSGNAPAGGLDASLCVLSSTAKESLAPPSPHSSSSSLPFIAACESTIEIRFVHDLLDALVNPNTEDGMLLPSVPSPTMDAGNVAEDRRGSTTAAAATTSTSRTNTAIKASDMNAVGNATAALATTTTGGGAEASSTPTVLISSSPRKVVSETTEQVSVSDSPSAAATSGGARRDSTPSPFGGSVKGQAVMNNNNLGTGGTTTGRSNNNTPASPPKSPSSRKNPIAAMLLAPPAAAKEANPLTLAKNVLNALLRTHLFISRLPPATIDAASAEGTTAAGAIPSPSSAAASSNAASSVGGSVAAAPQPQPQQLQQERVVQYALVTATVQSLDVEMAHLGLKLICN